MKKTILFFIAAIILSTSFGFSVNKISPATLSASETFISIGNNEKKISLIELSVISVKNYQQLTGKHLNFFQRLQFKASQKKLKNNINPDGTIDKAIVDEYYSDGDHSTGFHLGGFLLGLTIIGVVLAYVLPAADDDTKRNRVHWAWRGALAIITIGIGLYLAQSNSGF